MKKYKKRHIKLGDRVQVISGSQKGIIGTITSVQNKKETITIDTLPTRTKMTRGREMEDAKKIELPMFIHWSNVMLWDQQSNAASRIGHKQVENKKQRYFKKSGSLV